MSYGGQDQQAGYGGQHYNQPGQPNMQYAPARPHQPIKAPGPASDEYTAADDTDRFNYSEHQWRDPLWLFLFLAHLGGMIAAGVTYVPDFINTLDLSQQSGGGTSGIEYAYWQVAWMTAGTCVVAGIAGALWLGVMQMYAASIIKISLFVNVGMFVIMGFFMFAYVGQIFGGLMYWLLAGLTLLYYFAVRGRIPFTQAILASATESIKAFSGPVWVAYGCCFFQIIWFAAWGITATAVVYQFQEQGQEANGGLIFVLLVSAYWTSQVIINIGHVTTAGVVATWWFAPNNPSPTSGALKRALTTSLGSICFGSLIVAILKAAHHMVQQARKTDNDFARCIAACLLDCLERMIEYFNMYAYTQVAIYGKDFKTAAKDTWDLFKAKGFTMIINDDLTGMVLTMGCFIGAVVSAMSGAALAMIAYQDSDLALALGIAGFLIGFFVVAVIMNVIQSAVATTFVVWAEDSAACAAGQPRWFAKIREAARAMYPGERW
eukprot:gb/GEZN01005458.1/.p1 GENE.gb/GEZN01005458.1/~~gb/GEZN01005458.1/.p1  ORF type:complete len:491 (-),score=64.84 gb/GEZN01005458.1/:276-1748(-)